MTSYNIYIPRTFYQYSHSFEERCRLSAQLRKRYRNYIPIIFEPEEQCQHVTTTNSATLTSIRQCSNAHTDYTLADSQENECCNKVQDSGTEYGHISEKTLSTHEQLHNKPYSATTEKNQLEKQQQEEEEQRESQVCNYVMQNIERDSVSKDNTVNGNGNTIKSITNFLSPLPFAWAQSNWPRVQEYIANIQKCAENDKQEENSNENKNDNYVDNDNKCASRHNVRKNINSENCSSSYAVNENKTNALHNNSAELAEYKSYSPSSHNVYRVRSSNHYVIKFVMPARKTLSEVILTLRERLALHPHQAVFLTVGESDVLAPGNALLGELYERYKHPDGFLYIAYALENTFGSRSTETFTLEETQSRQDEFVCVDSVICEETFNYTVE